MEHCYSLDSLPLQIPVFPTVMSGKAAVASNPSTTCYFSEGGPAPSTTINHQKNPPFIHLYHSLPSSRSISSSLTSPDFHVPLLNLIPDFHQASILIHNLQIPPGHRIFVAAEVSSLPTAGSWPSLTIDFVCQLSKRG